MALTELSFASVWLAGAAAALVVVLCVLAFRRARGGLAGALLRGVAGAIAIVAVLAYFDQSARHERAESRRAFQARSAELVARALVPGSALACLDGAVGEAVETACEHKVFASPQSAAAAVAYVSAQLALLADAGAAPGRDPGLAATLAGLKRAVALDRYGIAAHVLAIRDGCTAERCPAFALVDDANALKSNLKAGVFDAYVSRYTTAWSKPEAQTPVAANPPSAQPAPAAPVPAASVPDDGEHRVAVPLSPKYDFPSADSIPPVSIMNKEPPLPNANTPVEEPKAGTPTAAATAEEAPIPLPPRRPQTQAAVPAPR
ncbi:MAG: hypothetical protein WBD48_11500 [Pseudolabrys sp.]